MLLRVPGLSEAEAERLGREVAQRIADDLPPGVGRRYLDNLNLQLTIPAGAPSYRLVEAISTAIINKLCVP